MKSPNMGTFPTPLGRHTWHTQDSQRLEELAASLKERFKTLTDRLARISPDEFS